MRIVLVIVAMLVTNACYAFEVVGSHAGSYITGNLERVSTMKDPLGRTVVGKINVSGLVMWVVGVDLGNGKYRVAGDTSYNLERK